MRAGLERAFEVIKLYHHDIPITVSLVDVLKSRIDLYSMSFPNVLIERK